MRRFWFISYSHFLLHLSTSHFAVDLTQLLLPRGKEEEGGLQACAGAASPGGLLSVSVLLPWGAVPQPAQAARLILTPGQGKMDIHSLPDQRAPGCLLTQ